MTRRRQVVLRALVLAGLVLIFVLAVTLVTQFHLPSFAVVLFGVPLGFCAQVIVRRVWFQTKLARRP